jgi:hypothetical protein
LTVPAIAPIVTAKPSVFALPVALIQLTLGTMLVLPGIICFFGFQYINVANFWLLSRSRQNTELFHAWWRGGKPKK